MKINDLEEDEKLIDFLYKDIVVDIKHLDDLISEGFFMLTEIITKKEKK